MVFELNWFVFFATLIQKQIFQNTTYKQNLRCSVARFRTMFKEKNNFW